MPQRLAVRRLQCPAEILSAFQSCVYQRFVVAVTGNVTGLLRNAGGRGLVPFLSKTSEVGHREIVDVVWRPLQFANGGCDFGAQCRDSLPLRCPIDRRLSPCPDLPPQGIGEPLQILGRAKHFLEPWQEVVENCLLVDQIASAFVSTVVVVG